LTEAARAGASPGHGGKGQSHCPARFHPRLKAAGKGTTTGKLFRAQEHDDLTVSHVLVRVIEGIDFERLRAKTVAKFITALTKYDGTEKTMTFRSRYAFDRFIRDHA
jgi:hypothetical protein